MSVAPRAFVVVFGRCRYGKPSLFNAAMLPGGFSSASPCVWSIQSSLSSTLCTFVGAESAAVRADRTTAIQTGSMEPCLCMTIIPDVADAMATTANPAHREWRLVIWAGPFAGKCQIISVTPSAVPS